MTRRDFLKKIGAGIMGFGMLCLFPLEEIGAATVTDNLADGGLHVGDTAPSNRTLLWMDTNTTPAMPKYWSGVDWAPCNADMLDSHDSSYFASQSDVSNTMEAVSTLQTRLETESGRIENEVNARVVAVTSEAEARNTADLKLGDRIGNGRGSSNVPVYVDASGNTAAVNGLDTSGFSVFKIPVNPVATEDINLWITT
jgi:hypothetical protein